MSKDPFAPDPRLIGTSWPERPAKTPAQHRRDFALVLILLAILGGWLALCVWQPYIGGGLGAVVAAIWIGWGLWEATG